MSNFTPVSSIALFDAAMRKRVSESGVRLMQTAIFTVGPLGKDSERNLAGHFPAASVVSMLASCFLRSTRARAQRAASAVRTLERIALTIGTVRHKPTVRKRFPSREFQIAAAARNTSSDAT